MLVFALKIHPGETIALAFDNDKAGEDYRKRAEVLLGSSNKAILEEIPKSKDWNEDLKKKRESGLI